MLNLVNNSTKETFRLPQSVHEIGFDYVSSCVEHIELRKHYALIALITTAPLVDLIDTNNKGLANTKAVLIKANYADENDNDKTPVNRFIFAAPSDLFNGIDCNTRKNELSIGHIRKFINTDKDLSMSIKRGTIFGKVGQSAAASVLKTLDTISHTLPKLDTTIIQTVTCVDYKIIRITDIIGHNNNEGIPENSPFNKFIVASNLLGL